MSDAPKSRRRSGGRAARTAARSQKLDVDKRPVRPGLPGGQYRPLSEVDVARINEAALTALEEIGFASAPPSGVEILTGAGAIMGDDGRIRFPRALVEDMLAIAARGITLCGRDPAHDISLQGTNTHFGTAGAAVHMVNVDTGDYREPSMQDLYDAARIVESLDNLHFFQRPVVCREFEDNLELDLHTLYAACAGTTKHVGTSFTEAANVGPCLELLHEIAGGEDAFRARPFVSNSNCFVVPPLTFAEESCEVMEACIHGGMPVLLLSAGQAGATAPAPIATAVVQAVAECLAAVVYVNALAPGHTAMFGTWPFVSDLRTGAMSGGSGEQALLTAACAQMHQFYGLPGGAAAGIADSKLPDMQAGWEQAISNVMAGLAGLNMVYEAAGMHASLMGFCFESLVLGNDMLGQVQRCVRGVEVLEEYVSIETMKSVVLDGPGHYLGHDQTLRLMQSEYIYPEIADRSSPKEWVEKGKPLLIDNAKARVAAILGRDGHKFTDTQEAALRARFDLRPLSRP
ncbi:trimethylamine methyltransferase family protein [Tropicimonas sp. TH_r6]|uniref:trimethylamine methyltransferase family protein n=1 Tax=Tropicimonas sp. TH_r6 TaxID=3082085 RepID=UPI0029536971|nr:trimethylamine methyltransferase family protein [Tropicimonas sp. TH_r6]MDV7143299.1 trimethylamine methyltransferase family protein [Tropicimonas sp. TH_r6]